MSTTGILSSFLTAEFSELLKGLLRFFCALGGLPADETDAVACLLVMPEGLVDAGC